jgi:hypothetical protein
MAAVPAHTDLTYVCLFCLTRVPPSAGCPACGRQTVASFGEPETAALVNARLESRSTMRQLPELVSRWGDLLFFLLLCLVELGLGLLAWGTRFLALWGIAAPGIAVFAWCSVNTPPVVLRRASRSRPSLWRRLRELWVPTKAGPGRLLVQLLLPIAPVVVGLASWLRAGGSGWGESILLATTWVVWGVPSTLAAVWLFQDVLFRDRGFMVFLVLAVVAWLGYEVLWASVRGDWSRPAHHVLVVLGVACAGVLVTDLCRLLHIQIMEDAAKPAVLRLPGPPATSDGATRTVPGRVQAVETLGAPLSGERCVGFRIVGEHTLGPIDDGRCLSFTLVADTGNPLPVEVGQAWIDLPPSGTKRTTMLEGSLGDFLGPRGFFAEKVELDEALLRDGDRVEVTGRVETRLRAEGYRGTVSADVLVGPPGSPLVIRGVPPA